ncbi:unnamed protein product [Notodromas monacha]|uniref:RING-type domain-containing protein n=1 Tax=Notodromas monacha TaxID=399045 RepID=A0A7R9BU73_9CRUS|nr:unnamed protein product [Notodromas monacha]CAG0920766.1 unnamed protein product [Notodromas monacha]
MPFFGGSKVDKAKLEEKLRYSRETPEPTFDLSECGLKDVPKIFATCKVFRKETLLLMENCLTSLAGGGNLYDLGILTHLNLASNRFSELPKDFGDCLISLKSLNVRDNQLKTLPESVSKLKFLECLIAANNRLQKIPESFSALNQLRELDLSRNKLKDIPSTFCKLKRLQHFYLEGNPDLIFPPLQDVKKGTIAIMQTLCERAGVAYEQQKDDDREQKDAFLAAQVDSDRRRSCHDAVFEAEIKIIRLDSFQQRVRQREMLETEERLKEIAAREEAVWQENLARSKQIISSLAEENKALDEKIKLVQEKKEKEREDMVQRIAEIESHSNDLIANLLAMNDSSRKAEADAILDQLLLSKVETDQFNNDRRVQTLEKMEKHLSELMQKEVLTLSENSRLAKEFLKTAEEQNMVSGEKLSELTTRKASERQALVKQVLTDEDMQRQMLLSLIMQRDTHRVAISTQLEKILEQLAALSKAEAAQKDLRMKGQMAALESKRKMLSDVLAALIVQKQIREEELATRLKEMEDQISDSQDGYWIIQYQRLLDTAPETLRDADARMDWVLRDILTRVGAQKYIPHFARRRLTAANCVDYEKEDYMMLGIKDADVVKAIMKEIAEYKIQQLKAQEKLSVCAQDVVSTLVVPSAPPLEISTDVSLNEIPEPSAPPVALTARIEEECVVCMDKKCEMVFLNCGHVCCCKECSNPIVDCPLCRSKIVARIILVGDSVCCLFCEEHRLLSMKYSMVKSKLPRDVTIEKVNRKLKIPQLTHWKSEVRDTLTSCMKVYDRRLNGIPYKFSNAVASSFVDAAGFGTVSADFWIFRPASGRCYQMRLLKISGDRLFLGNFLTFSVKVECSPNNPNRKEADSVAEGDILEFEYSDYKVSRKMIVLCGEFRRLVRKTDGFKMDRERVAALLRSLTQCGLLHESSENLGEESGEQGPKQVGTSLELSNRDDQNDFDSTKKTKSNSANISSKPPVEGEEDDFVPSSQAVVTESKNVKRKKKRSTAIPNSADSGLESVGRVGSLENCSSWTGSVDEGEENVTEPAISPTLAKKTKKKKGGLTWSAVVSTIKLNQLPGDDEVSVSKLSKKSDGVDSDPDLKHKKNKSISSSNDRQNAIDGPFSITGKKGQVPAPVTYPAVVESTSDSDSEEPDSTLFMKPSSVTLKQKLNKNSLESISQKASSKGKRSSVSTGEKSIAQCSPIMKPESPKNLADDHQGSKAQEANTTPDNSSTSKSLIRADSPSGSSNLLSKVTPGHLSPSKKPDVMKTKECSSSSKKTVLECFSSSSDSDDELPHKRPPCIDEIPEPLVSESSDERDDIFSNFLGNTLKSVPQSYEQAEDESRSVTNLKSSDFLSMASGMREESSDSSDEELSVQKDTPHVPNNSKSKPNSHENSHARSSSHKRDGVDESGDESKKNRKASVIHRVGNSSSSHDCEGGASEKLENSSKNILLPGKKRRKISSVATNPKSSGVTKESSSESTDEEERSRQEAEPNLPNDSVNNPVHKKGDAVDSSSQKCNAVVPRSRPKNQHASSFESSQRGECSNSSDDSEEEQSEEFGKVSKNISFSEKQFKAKSSIANFRPSSIRTTMTSGISLESSDESSDEEISPQTDTTFVSRKSEVKPAKKDYLCSPLQKFNVIATRDEQKNKHVPSSGNHVVDEELSSSDEEEHASDTLRQYSKISSSGKAKSSDTTNPKSAPKTLKTIGIRFESSDECSDEEKNIREEVEPRAPNDDVSSPSRKFNPVEPVCKPKAKPAASSHINISNENSSLSDTSEESTLENLGKPSEKSSLTTPSYSSQKISANTAEAVPQSSRRKKSDSFASSEGSPDLRKREQNKSTLESRLGKSSGTTGPRPRSKLTPSIENDFPAVPTRIPTSDDEYVGFCDPSTLECVKKRASDLKPVSPSVKRKRKQKPPPVSPNPRITSSLRPAKITKRKTSGSGEGPNAQNAERVGKRPKRNALELDIDENPVQDELKNDVVAHVLDAVDGKASQKSRMKNLTERSQDEFRVKQSITNAKRTKHSQISGNENDDHAMSSGEGKSAFYFQGLNDPVKRIFEQLREAAIQCSMKGKSESEAFSAMADVLAAAKRTVPASTEATADPSGKAKQKRSNVGAASKKSRKDLSSSNSINQAIKSPKSLPAETKLTRRRSKSQVTRNEYPEFTETSELSTATLPDDDEEYVPATSKSPKKTRPLKITEGASKSSRKPRAGKNSISPLNSTKTSLTESAASGNSNTCSQSSLNNGGVAAVRYRKLNGENVPSQSSGLTMKELEWRRRIKEICKSSSSDDSSEDEAERTIVPGKAVNPMRTPAVKRLMKGTKSSSHSTPLSNGCDSDIQSPNVSKITLYGKTPEADKKRLRDATDADKTKLQQMSPSFYSKAEIIAKMKPLVHQVDYFGTMKHFFCAPKSYLILGVSGLIPFAFPTFYCVVSGTFYPDMIHAQVVYGASILAFLGGVRWGHLLGTEGIKASTKDVAISTIPSLAAVMGLLMSHPFSDMAVMLSLAGAGFYDGLWQAYPVWFRAIRLGLTTIAVGSIFIALFARMILPHEKQENVKVK